MILETSSLRWLVGRIDFVAHNICLERALLSQVFALISTQNLMHSCLKKRIPATAASVQQLLLLISLPTETMPSNATQSATHSRTGPHIVLASVLHSFFSSHFLVTATIFAMYLCSVQNPASLQSIYASVSSDVPAIPPFQ